MKLTRSLLSLILALLLVFSLGAAVFAADYPESGFADVPRDVWYTKAVDYVKAEGLMKGIGENRFDPTGSVTRAMVVTVLYRMMEQPDVTGMQTKFTDIRVGTYYEKAVIWAANSGVVNGVTDTAFAPDDFIKREQMAAMIMRMLLTFADDESRAQLEQIEQLDPTGAARQQMLKEAFTDAAAVSPYARTYVLLCKEGGIMKGDKAGTFRPQETLSRAECAQTFLNLSEIGASLNVQ
jgi:hypothetical protein